MISNETIKELTCPISDDFIIEPIPLTCGHSACRNCIPDEHIEEIKCKFL